MSIFKKIAAITVAGLILSSLALAHEEDEPVKRAATNNFCTRIANVQSELNTSLGNLETDRGKKRLEALDKLKERKTERSAEVQEKRDETKNKFDEAIIKLNAQATTDEQKAAVSAFKAAVEVANATRKAAVDSAMKTFRDSVQSLVTQRQDGIKTASDAFRTSVKAATTKAKSDCIAGTDPSTVKQTLTNSIKAAKDKFHSDMQALDKIGQKVRDATKLRNEAIQAAHKAFKDAAVKARQDLKAAFPSA